MTESFAALKIVFRNRQNVFWGFAFPLLFVFAFSLFKGGSQVVVRTHIIAPEQGPAKDVASSLEETLLQSRTFRVTKESADAAELPTQDDIKARIEGDETDVAIVVANADRESISKVEMQVLYNEAEVLAKEVAFSSISSFVDQTNLRAAGITAGFAKADFVPAAGRRVNFFDYTLAGFIAYGVASISVIGMASAMVGYRKSQIIKRLACTPVSPVRFVLAHVAARLVLSAIQVVVIIVVARLLGAHIYGNPAWAVVLVVIGNIAFLNLGLALSGIIRGGPEVASAAGTAITLPMFILSGAFFSLTDLPLPVRLLAKALPLTPLVEGTRGILLENHSFLSLGPQLLLLVFWILGSLFLAIAGSKNLFRYE